MATGRSVVPTDLSPYQLQPLIDVVAPEFAVSDPPVRVQCAQASGGEIYLGCSNGDLLRFALQPSQSPSTLDSYTLLSRQSVPNNRPIDDIVLVPNISRALVLSERQVFVYTLPILDMIPSTVYKPIRHVLSIAVDEHQLRHRPSRNNSPPAQPNSISFCAIKRQSVSVFDLREKPIYVKDIPLPSRIFLAKRSGKYLCVADHENYNMIDMETASLFPLLPISQAPPGDAPAEGPPAPAVRPFILVVSASEFLMLSWTGASTLGLFITGEGEPVRGTLEWSSHPVSVAFDSPHVTTLLPDGTIEIHNIDTQTLVQTVPPPSASPSPAFPIPTDRKAVLACAAGFSVPSAERQAKLRLTPVKLRRPKAPSAPVAAPVPEADVVQEPSQAAAQERSSSQTPQPEEEREEGQEQEQVGERGQEQEHELNSAVDPVDSEAQDAEAQDAEAQDVEAQGAEAQDAERAEIPERNDDATADAAHGHEQSSLDIEVETNGTLENGHGTEADEPTPYDLGA